MFNNIVIKLSITSRANYFNVSLDLLAGFWLKINYNVLQKREVLLLKLILCKEKKFIYIFYISTG